MTPHAFIAKWQAANLSERSACQQHFLDLCELLGQPKPAAADPEGAWYCFERGVSKTDGGQGWADVWMKDHFGWEYKGKHKDLKAAYNQLLNYRESLENPPLLVVCDLNRFEIHTNFTGTAKKVYDFDLAGLAEPKNLETLRRLFTEPETLKPGLTTRSVTEQAAEHFGRLADGLRLRGVEAQEAAHFLMKLMFCMFAEDIELLPKKLFSRTIDGAKKDPAKLSAFLRELFQAMARGGSFALEDILYFNGGLFADAQVIDLTADEIKTLVDAAAFDWSVVEPHIFGTLFERMLDPAKRSQIGAHYTGSDDIKTLLEPVMMTPLRREWAAVREKAEALLPKLAAEAGKQTRFRFTSLNLTSRQSLAVPTQHLCARTKTCSAFGCSIHAQHGSHLVLCAPARVRASRPNVRSQEVPCRTRSRTLQSTLRRELYACELRVAISKTALPSRLLQAAVRSPFQAPRRHPQIP